MVLRASRTIEVRDQALDRSAAMPIEQVHVTDPSDTLKKAAKGNLPVFLMLNWLRAGAALLFITAILCGLL